MFPLYTVAKNILDTEETNKAGYIPSFSTSTSSSKICKLYKKRGQGNYNLCWAATVATIANYRNGVAVTAKQVADSMGIAYSSGGSCSAAQQALRNYGISYASFRDNVGNKMTWGFLKKNINNKYPVYVHAVTTKTAHAVTAYGYSIAGGSKYVVFWNSGNKTSTTVEFKNTGTTFSYGNKTYTWAKSVSKF